MLNFRPGGKLQIGRPEVAILQVIKRRLPTGLEIERRIAQGCPKLIVRLRQTMQKMPDVINTVYIERLNAAFRSRLSWLTRRIRTLVQQLETLTAGLYIVGCFYNLCDVNHSLRIRLAAGRFGRNAHRRWPQP